MKAWESHILTAVLGVLVGVVIMLALTGCHREIIPCPQYILIMQVQSQNQGQYQIEFDLPAGMTNKYFQIQMDGSTNFSYYYGSNGNIKPVNSFPTNIFNEYLKSFWDSSNRFKQ